MGSKTKQLAMNKEILVMDPRNGEEDQNNICNMNILRPILGSEFLVRRKKANLWFVA